MKVLIVGSGAREHALAWRLNQSPLLTGLWVASGNPGTAAIATNLEVGPEDLDGIAAAARSLGIDLVVVGPELPLAHGLVDRLSGLGLPAFGPTRAAARIEASKSFALELMQEAGVPCPRFWVFRDEQEALRFLEDFQEPVVVKADGLAAGKGVSICRTPEEAATAVRACMTDRIYGEAGDVVIIEEMLAGTEVSVFAFTDGKCLSSLVAACDYKRLRDGGEGPNTGGMGSFAPPDFWTDALADEINSTIMQPTIEAMARRGSPYQGVLYAGVMLTNEGPKVLEFNCRWGDPEAQVVLPLLDSDPLEVMAACVQGRLARTPVQWRAESYVGVVMVSGGYPGRYETGFEITGLDGEDEHTMVFHAGTRLAGNLSTPTLAKGGSGSILAKGGEGEMQRVVTAGGRVLTVVGRGDSLAQARTRAYHRARRIHFEQAFYRTDIAAVGQREIAWAPDPAAPAG